MVDKKFLENKLIEPKAKDKERKEEKKYELIRSLDKERRNNLALIVEKIIKYAKYLIETEIENIKKKKVSNTFLKEEGKKKLIYIFIFIFFFFLIG
jgi:hypothetical protein